MINVKINSIGDFVRLAQETKSHIFFRPDDLNIKGRENILCSFLSEVGGNPIKYSCFTDKETAFNVFRAKEIKPIEASIFYEE